MKLITDNAKLIDGRGYVVAENLTLEVGIKYLSLGGTKMLLQNWTATPDGYYSAYTEAKIEWDQD